ncbi:hypothetical protein IVA79_24525 [Bradyrhizobium sp. 138]|nr:hypothetical protein [Bradyrhizobium sp. 138]
MVDGANTLLNALNPRLPLRRRRHRGRDPQRNLDYFGQTVNVAARVQVLADAGQICLSEALYSARGVCRLLAGHAVIEFDAPLRGVEGIACMHRVVRRIGSCSSTTLLYILTSPALSASSPPAPRQSPR